MAAGEPVREALVREAREELGIDASSAVRLYSWLREGSFESEFAECFLLETAQPVRPDPVEIDEVRYCSVTEVQAMLGTGMLTPMFEEEWPMLLAARERLTGPA